MSKIKLIIICLAVFFVILISAILIKLKIKNDYKQKAVLALEIHKALDQLMLDLSQTREKDVLGLPADGSWHDRLVFREGQLGVLEYLLKDGDLWRNFRGKSTLIAGHIGILRIRRQAIAPDILELQVIAQSKVTLVSNLRIRTRE